jgi:hypothetical protein
MTIAGSTALCMQVLNMNKLCKKVANGMLSCIP